MVLGTLNGALIEGAQADGATIVEVYQVVDLRSRCQVLAMIEREPSRTAFAAASYRAVHQVLEGGRVFSDRLAVPILGVDAEAIRADVAEHEARRGIRFFVVARARLAEDAVLRAVEMRGVRQLVVLGAGLDTFGYRHAFGDQLRVFEVDHPATQA